MRFPRFDDPIVYAFLFQIDKDLASETREKGCPHCRGVLHSARYPRKLQGFSMPLDSEKSARFSFCCSTDGCRRRVTPPSVRFLGRKRYLSAVVVLLSAMVQGPNQKRTRELEELIGVNRKTLLRWQMWWRGAFLNSRFWQYCRSLMMPPLDSARVCLGLVERFSAQCEIVNLARLLRFLSPLSCPSPVIELQAIC